MVQRYATLALDVRAPAATDLPVDLPRPGCVWTARGRRCRPTQPRCPATGCCPAARRRFGPSSNGRWRYAAAARYANKGKPRFWVLGSPKTPKPAAWSPNGRRTPSICAAAPGSGMRSDLLAPRGLGLHQQRSGLMRMAAAGAGRAALFGSHPRAHAAPVASGAGAAARPGLHAVLPAHLPSAYRCLRRQPGADCSTSRQPYRLSTALAYQAHAGRHLYHHRPHPAVQCRGAQWAAVACCFAVSLPRRGF